MRLFKYLVISNDLIDPDLGLIKNSDNEKGAVRVGKYIRLHREVPSDFMNDKLFEVFYTVKVKESTNHISYKRIINPFPSEEKYVYFQRRKIYDVNRTTYKRVDNRFYILKPYAGLPGIVLMGFKYTNTCNKDFKGRDKNNPAQGNTAYVVIDEENIINLMQLARGRNFVHDENGNGYIHPRCYENCLDNFYCKSGNTCLSLKIRDKVLGGTWSTIHSSQSTTRIESVDKIAYDIEHKEESVNNINKIQKYVKAAKPNRAVTPNSDGILTTYACFDMLKSRKQLMTLHQWLKCGSINVNYKGALGESDIVHIGHTFDNRVKYLKRLKTGVIKDYFNAEKKNNVFRSSYVTVGTSYIAETLECNCSTTKGMDCDYCEGVLHINSIRGLKDLYDHLTSKEYENLEKMIR